MINIKQLKLNYINKYPNSTLTSILLQEKDTLKDEEFLAKIDTWLKILSSEEIEKGGG
jgi:hypothetical protein